jgi:putative ABC transport system permease protein
MLGFTFSVVMLCAAVLAFVWAIRSWHTDPAGEMKSRSVASSASGGVTNLRKILIVTEVALSVVLLTSAGLLIHSFLLVKAVDPGMDTEQVLTVNLSLAGGSSGWPSSVFAGVVARLQALPGVKDAGAIDSLFDLGPTNSLGLRSIEGRPPEPREQWTALTWDTVRGDYFQAIGAQLLRGRYFSEEDSPHSPLVAVIDESAALRYWPHENAIGKRFKGQDRRGQNDDWLTVIGVVRDIRTHGLERQPTAHIYEWYQQSSNATPDLVVRVAGSPERIASTIRQTIRSVAPAAILSNISTVDQQLSQQLAPRRFQTLLLGLVSLVALLLAAVGIYGLMHFSVTQRTREIGVRMALGAQRSSVYRLVIGQAGWLTAVGLAIGLLCSMGTSMLMRRLLFGIQAWDTVTLGSDFVARHGIGGGELSARASRRIRRSDASPTERMIWRLCAMRDVARR